MGVEVGILLAEVFHVAASLVDESDESAAGVEVFGVAVHVEGEVSDAGGESRGLDLGRPDVVVVESQVGDGVERVAGGGSGHGRAESGRGWEWEWVGVRLG